VLSHDPAAGWYAAVPRGPLVRVEPFPWTRPATWDMEERVALGLTSHGTCAFLSHASIVRLTMWDRAISGPLVAEGALVHANRGRIVEQFLDAEALGEFLLCVDADMVVALDLGRALVSVAKALHLDVTSQCYATVRGTCEAGLYNPEAEDMIEDIAEPAWGTVAPVDFVGAGAVLLRRSFLVRMRDAYHGEGRDALFCPAPNRPQWGEDYSFCARARAIGARIATANLTRISHCKTVPLALQSQRNMAGAR